VKKRPWLLVGLSMRPLAESAARFGHDICVIDACADRDTRQACGDRLVRLECGTPWRIDAAALQAAVVEARLRFAPDGFAGIIPGSGFEAQPELLELLAAHAPIVGCDSGTVQAVREPRRWFELLDRIGAPHPAVRFDNPPTDPAGWLAKSAGGSGGWHIRICRSELPTTASDYFQQHTLGRPASALFLADGRSARIIGWQWQRIASSADWPWRYGGVIAAPDLAPGLRDRVASVCSAIVERVPVRGIAGLDFLVDGEHFSVLELNPRPAASIALYPQKDFLALHSRANYGPSAGALSVIAVAENSEIAGEAVLYAAETLPIAASFAWPVWCSDIPGSNSHIAAGQPICTVRASAETPQAVEAMLTRRLQTLSIALKEHTCHDRLPHQRQYSGPTARPGAAL
jgi:predicted ATP-grasp superfamily ATP-dependent carboligase